MAATPQYGQMIFIGANTGKTYCKDIYVSDVNAGLINFDGGSGAGTTSPLFCTFSEPVVLRDYSMVTGTADTEKIRLILNDSPTGYVLRYVPHLTTNANRPVLNIGINPNVRIAFQQISD